MLNYIHKSGEEKMADWWQSEIDDVRKGVMQSAEELKKLNKKQDQSLENDKAIIEAFNNLGKQIENLAREVKGLRDDLNPSLDKKSKLPRPGVAI